MANPRQTTPRSSLPSEVWRVSGDAVGPKARPTGKAVKRGSGATPDSCDKMDFTTFAGLSDGDLGDDLVDHLVGADAVGGCVVGQDQTVAEHGVDD